MGTLQVTWNFTVSIKSNTSYVLSYSDASLKIIIVTMLAWSDYDLSLSPPLPSSHGLASTESKKSLSKGVIIGAVAGGTILLLLLLLAGVYALRQKRRAERASEQLNPFGKKFMI
jgi:hypothetical protein